VGTYTHRLRALEHVQRRDPLAAAQSFLAAGDRVNAARQLARAGRVAEALDMFMAAGEKHDAARLLRSEGHYTQAAELFEELRDWQRAGACWQRADNKIATARCLAATGHVWEAGLLAASVGEANDTIRYWHAVPATSPHYVKANQRLLALFERRGRDLDACRSLAIVLSDSAPSSENLGRFFDLIGYQERYGLFEDALATVARLRGTTLSLEDADAMASRLGSALATQRALLGPFGAGAAARYQFGPRLNLLPTGSEYMAYDRQYSRVVVVRFLDEWSGLTADGLDRLALEARTLGRLSHPGIAQVTGLETQPAPFLTMELVEGRDLAAVMRHSGGPIPHSKIMEFAGSLCHALAYAHRASVTHGALDPTNIMLTWEGDVKLVGLGLSTTTISSRYHSPEHCDPSQIGPLSDIYSLGAVLHACYAGSPSKSGAADSASWVPPFVLAALERAMAPDPQDRYPTAQEFWKDLSGSR